MFPLPKKTRIILFLTLCFTLRLAIAYIAKITPQKYLPYLGYLAFIPAIGFAYTYINTKKIEANVIRLQGKAVAYTIIHNDILKEAVIEKGFEKSVISFIIKLRKKRKKVKNLLIQLSSGNSIIKNLRKYSHTENLRYVYEGGHTIRIHNIGNFLAKILPVIQNRLKEVSPIKFELSICK